MLILSHENKNLRKNNEENIELKVNFFVFFLVKKIYFLGNEKFN